MDRGEKTITTHDRKFIGRTIILLAFLCIILFLVSCGYSEEERARMRKIAETGEKNAVNYIQEKYGFLPGVVRVDRCMKRDEVFSDLYAEGCVVAVLEHEGKEFRVHISGESVTVEGVDDFQRELIEEEADRYFADLLGYEICDIYLEYREEPVEDRYSDDQEKNMISEFYRAGDFDNFIKRHTVYCRIDDFLNRDIAEWAEKNPEAVSFLENHVSEYGMRIVLISYRSEEDYENGYTHTYGRGGLMDFDIEQDSLYIRSYMMFVEEGVEYNCFEIQEYDGILFGCIDRKAGADLLIESGRNPWRDLGETKKDPVSEIYSVSGEESGFITVYIPADRYENQWNGRSLYIQHNGENGWSQYEKNIWHTSDKKYIFFMYPDFYGGDFDFAVFP